MPAPEKRLLKQTEAAEYCGVSLGTFLDQVRRGIYPRETLRDGRIVLWDRHRLDKAIDALAPQADSPACGWDDV